MQKLLYKIAKITSIALLTLSINNNVYAGGSGIVFDPSNLSVNLPTDISTTFSAVSNAVSSLKDSTEMTTWIQDKIIFPIIKSQVVNFTKEASKWIETGFNGEPAFITNPAGFAQNILAQQLNTEVYSSLSVINNKINGGIGLITDITKQTSNNYQQDVVGALVNRELMRYKAIHQSLCDPSNQQLIEKYDKISILYLNTKYCNKAVSNMTDQERASMEKLYVSLRAPISKFSYYNAVLQGNTRVNVSMGIAAEINKKTTDAQDKIRDELLQNGGFLGEIECVKKEVNGNCIEKKTVTPGSLLKDSASFLQLQSVRTLEDVKNWDQLTAWSGTYLTNAFVKLGQNTVNKAVVSSAKALTDALDKLKKDVDATIWQGLSDLAKDLTTTSGICLKIDEYGQQVEVECISKGNSLSNSSNYSKLNGNNNDDKPKTISDLELAASGLTQQAYRKIRLTGSTTLQTVVVGTTTIDIHPTPELFNIIREYKKNWFPIFNQKFSNTLNRYKKLNNVYERVTNKILPEEKIVKRYNTTQKVYDKYFKEKQKFPENYGEDVLLAIPYYKWKKKFVTDIVGESKEINECDDNQKINVSEVKTLVSLYYCFNVADSMEMVDNLIKKLDEFDSKINAGNNNKKINLSLVDKIEDYEIGGPIIYEKEISEDATWQGYYEAGIGLKQQDSTSYYKNLKIENDKTNPSMKNRAFYLNFYEFNNNNLDDGECYGRLKPGYYWDNDNCTPSPSGDINTTQDSNGSKNHAGTE